MVVATSRVIGGGDEMFRVDGKKTCELEGSGRRWDSEGGSGSQAMVRGGKGGRVCE